MCVYTKGVAGDLMIRNIQLKHAGKYVCVIDTDVESLSAAAILIVKGKKIYIYIFINTLAFHSERAT